MRLTAAAIPQLPRIIGWASHMHSIYLVLEHVDGVNLAHEHDSLGENTPDFVRFLAGIPLRDKIGQALDLLQALGALRACGLVFQDVRIEQVIVAEGSARLIDVDTIVLGSGLGARKATWLPAGLIFGPSGCDWATDAQLAARCMHELFTGHHSGGDIMLPPPIRDALALLRRASADHVGSDDLLVGAATLLAKVKAG